MWTRKHDAVDLTPDLTIAAFTVEDGVMLYTISTTVRYWGAGACPFSASDNPVRSNAADKALTCGARGDNRRPQRQMAAFASRAMRTRPPLFGICAQTLSRRRPRSAYQM